MIGSLTRTNIDARARDLATRIRQVQDDTKDFQTFLQAALAAGALTDPAQGGYPENPANPGQPGPELVNVLGAADEWAYWANLLAESYGKNVPSLWPETRGQV